MDGILSHKVSPVTNDLFYFCYYTFNIKKKINKKKIVSIKIKFKIKKKIQQIYYWLKIKWNILFLLFNVLLLNVELNNFMVSGNNCVIDIKSRCKISHLYRQNGWTYLYVYMYII